MKYTTPEMDVVLVSAEDIMMSQQGGGNKGEFDDEEV